MTYTYAKSLAIVAACAVLVPLSNGALADTSSDTSKTAATPVKPGNAAPQVEAVIVTAQRRSQNLQKVPVTDTAFSAQQLRDRQVITVSNVLANVPNVVTLSGSGYSQANYYFRGIGESDGYQTFDSPIATYVDDVVLGRLGGANSELLDLERVEVLQGPQGTVFGRNTTGGAVLLYSKKPTDDFHALAETAYGTNNQTDTKIMLNGAVAPKLDARFTGFVFHNDGTQHDINTGQGDYGGQTNYGVRGALRYRPNEDIDWNVAFDFSRQNGQRYDAATNPNYPTQWAQPIGILGGSYTALTTSLNNCTKGVSALDWENNNCSGSITTNMGLTSNVKWTAADNLSLEFITGLRRDAQDYTLDVGFDNPYSELKDLVLANDSDFEQFSQEVKVSGKLANDLINYVGGIYIYNEWDETRLNEFLRFGTALQATPSERTDDYNEFLRNGTQSEAAYLQTDFHILPNLTLTTGIRYTHDRKEVGVNVTDPAAGNAPVYNTSEIAGQPVLSTYHFTPKIALTYQVTPDFMTYGSYTDGFKSGGWNGRASTAAEFTSFGNEKAQSWELGWRSELFDKRLRFNGTFFWVNYSDLQLASAYVAANGENEEIFTNAGNSQVRGMQLESVAAVTDNLTVNASLGMEEAKFTELASGVALAGITLKSPVPFSPPLTYNIGAAYNTDQLEWARGNFTLTGTFQYIPDYNAGGSSTSTDSPVTEMVNASITYHPAGSRWSVGAECLNCLFRYFPIQTGSFDYTSLPGYAGVRVRFEM
jgi:iron complex outermembrane receptor protein